MNLQRLLQWCAGLSEDDGRRAAVMLGVCWEYAGSRTGELPDLKSVLARVRREAQAFQLLRFSFRARYSTIPAEWYEKHSAQQMLQLFPELEELIIYSPSHIEMQGSLDGPSLQIVNWLSPLVVCTLRNDKPKVAISWKWPIRLGFGGDEFSEELRQACWLNITNTEAWASNLSLTKTLDAHNPDCDIFFIPCDGTLPDWFQAIRPGSMSADACVLLSAKEVPFDALATCMKRVRRTVRPSAVAWQMVGADGTGALDLAAAAEFSKHIVRELSHSLPFDKAFYLAAMNSNLLPGAVVSSRRFLRNSALGNRMLNQREILSRLPSREIELPPDFGIVRSTGSLLRLKQACHLAKEFPEHALDAGFFHETDMATTMREIDRKTTQVIQEEEMPRFLQAKARLRDASAKRSESLQAFVRGQTHVLDVCIAGKIEGWMSPQRGVPFPDKDLPAELDEHELIISLAVLHAPYPCWSKKVILPRRGPSETAIFQLDEFPDAETITLRILVSFRNRILQTALLRGSVIDEEGDAAELPLSLDVESLTVNRFDGLHERSQFDSALLVNRTGDNAEAVTFISDSRVRMADLEDLRKTRTKIDGAISNIAYNVKDFPDLYAEETQKLLWKLAYIGNEQRRQIEKLNGGKKLNDRIQILCVEPRHQLPIEYCYDGDRPVDNAPVCEHAREALRQGKCLSQCPVANRMREVVCPLKFWACNRVIERYVFDPNQSVATVDAFEQQWRTAASRRREMNPFDRMLYGVSQEVAAYDPKLPGRLTKALGRLPKGTLHPVEAWPDWKDTLKQHPSTLLVIGHVELDSGLLEVIQKIEIGGSSWLRAPEWDEHVKVADAAPPLVILLGCEAGSPEIEYLGFVDGILRGGAGIVMTTNSTIHSLHAVELIEALLPKLRDVCYKEGTFGEALRDARRMTLADSSPMALCVMAFGDADWRLLRSDWFTEPVETGIEISFDPSPGGAANKVKVSDVQVHDHHQEQQLATSGG